MPRQRLGVALVLPPPASDAIDTLRAAAGDGSLTRIPAHLTLVPPVNVRDDDVAQALARLRTAASSVRPFTLTLGPPATFLPDNPVLYLAVGGVESALASLHTLRDAVFQPPLQRSLAWPYVPHVTLADDAPPDKIAAAVRGLDGFTLDVTFTTLHLLREDERVWRPIADARLGPPAVIGRGAGPFELEITESEQLEPASAAWAELQWQRYDRERYGPDAHWDEVPFALVARRDGTVVASATGYTRGGAGYLRDVIVGVDVRGEGVGSHLMAGFEDLCRRRGVRRLALRTERDGPAHGFYERLGWRVEAVIAQWSFGRDTVQMRKDL